MWKSVVGHNVSMKVAAEGDDWETDPDFENDVSEQEQRWGAKTIEGSGRKEHISVAELRKNVAVEHEQGKQKDQTPKASYGYGGKFGVEKDRMDKVALGHDYVAQVEQHSSQKDAAQGFGGKFGVQKDRVDKTAMGFEYKGEVSQHASQKDYSKGFGGKYGVEKEKVDKAALGYDYKGQTEKHQSQKDYAKGFGGKYGVEKEKVDKAALGYDYKGETEKHQSQKGTLKLEDSKREEEIFPPPASDVAQDETPDVEYDMTHHMSEIQEIPEPEPESEEGPLYEVPPDLPPRSDNFLELDVPPLPDRSADVEEDEGEYEDLDAPPPVLTGADNDYEDLSSGQRAVAIYDYEGEADDEISFNPDDVITNIEMIDEGWWKGHCHGRVGLFPASYVQLMQ
ncbi:hematopoietic lineage cell-specific protein [Etheostoma cragini]|uniref:hematopoietic lineage cell-specific protein n=1 Tax=Etheostoma cragini TaxID=417921 RepID=UPI00155EB6C1|nr:hematopoietic lineage cell-specific protein [Etheostoma cragini]